MVLQFRQYKKKNKNCDKLTTMINYIFTNLQLLGFLNA